MHQVVASRLCRPDGTVQTKRGPVVWTLAHRGYSGRGRLDLWLYPSKSAALKAGAILALECGLDDDPTARGYFARDQYQKVLDRYEQLSPDDHLLRVLPSWIREDHDGTTTSSTN